MSCRSWVLVEWLDGERRPSGSSSAYEIVHTAAVACKLKYITPDLIIYINIGNNKYRRAKILDLSESKRLLMSHKETLDSYDRITRDLEKMCCDAVEKIKILARYWISETDKMATSTTPSTNHPRSQICEKETQTDWSTTTPILFEEKDVTDHPINRLKDKRNASKAKDDENNSEQAAQVLLTRRYDNPPETSDPIPKTSSNVTETKIHDASVILDKDGRIRGPSEIKLRESQNIENIDSEQTTDPVMDAIITRITDPQAETISNVTETKMHDTSTQLDKDERVARPLGIYHRESPNIENIYSNQPTDPDIAEPAEQVILTVCKDNPPEISDSQPETISNVTETEMHYASVLLDKDERIARPSVIQYWDSKNIENKDSNQTVDSDMPETISNVTETETHYASMLLDKDERIARPSVIQYRKSLNIENIDLNQTMDPDMAEPDEQVLLTGNNDNPLEISDPHAETISNVTETKMHDASVLQDKDEPEIPGSSGIPRRESPFIENIDSNPTMDSDMIPIGKGNARVPARVMASLDWNNYSFAATTIQLLDSVFPRYVLATHCLSGKMELPDENKTAKRQLDPKLVDDIVDIVSSKCNVSKFMVGYIIASKCKSEEDRLITIVSKKDANIPQAQYSTESEDS